MIGVVLYELSNTQKSHEVVNQLNQQIDDYVVFIENQGIPNQKTEFPYFHTQYMWHVKGTLLLTELHQIEYMKNISNVDYYYYMYDLDWLRYKDYESVLGLLQSSKIICRSENYRKEIEKFTGRPVVCVMPTFDALKFKELVCGKV